MTLRTPKEEQQRLFAPAQSVITAHIDRADLSLAFVAARVGVSVWQLSRAFSACRLDVRACVRRAQMRSAGVRLVHEPESSIKAVAIDVGYRHQGDFRKHFKEYWSMTPSAFRDRYLGGQAH